MSALEELLLLGREEFLERVAKTLLCVTGRLKVPSGESLIIPELYSLRVYGELTAHGDVVAEGELVVY